MARLLRIRRCYAKQSEDIIRALKLIKHKWYACILYYQVQNKCFFKKKTRKMGIGLNMLANTVGSVAGEIGSELGYGLSKLTGVAKSRAKDQINQQQKLTDMQSKANLALMKESYKEQQQIS